MGARAIVRVLLACNNRCVFCAQDGLPITRTEVETELTALRARSDEVTFVGGEPMLEPRLTAFIGRAKGLGFRRIGVQTNGRGLAAPDFAPALAGAGLTDVHLSVHGADAAVHDYH